MVHKRKKNCDEQQQFDFCEVCRLNHNHGRRHNFFPSHKSSLSALLSRYQSKLSDVRFFLRTPMRLRPEHAHQNRIWCVFCNCDVVELDSSFACGNAIEHMVSGEHWKRVKEFMWKYGGGMDRVDSFRITEVDYAKWEKKCNSLKTEAVKAESVRPVVGPSKNIHNDLNAENVISFQKNSVDSLKSCIANDVAPLHSYTNERAQASCSMLSSVSVAGSSLRNMHVAVQAGNAQGLNISTGFMDDQHCSSSHANEYSSYVYHNESSAMSGVRLSSEENTSPDLLHLTRISNQAATEGNVHSGAPPPWFDVIKGNQLDVDGKLELGKLASSKVRKSSKLNPKRVGAAWAERRKIEMELERRGELVGKFDANWLPNFGRVWQSGTRKESRKEFQLKNKASPKGDDQTEASMPLQPYISKRMRRDTNE